MQTSEKQPLSQHAITSRLTAHKILLKTFFVFLHFLDQFDCISVFLALLQYAIISRLTVQKIFLYMKYDICTCVFKNYLLYFFFCIFFYFNGMVNTKFLIQGDEMFTKFFVGQLLKWQNSFCVVVNTLWWNLNGLREARTG